MSGFGAGEGRDYDRRAARLLRGLYRRIGADVEARAPRCLTQPLAEPCSSPSPSAVRDGHAQRPGAEPDGDAPAPDIEGGRLPAGRAPPVTPP